MTDFLAVIPARGGSKGIPQKNLATLAGKPLVAHTIEQALACPRIGRVVVSTDDEEIAKTSQRWGAEVVRRPADISGDETTSEAVLLHVLDTLAEVGEEPAAVVLLQATSPLRRPDD
ncbi:MAG: acylneuraminate cytidylyltransferase family protein, partial [Planctomycetota bacterium]